MGHGAERPRSVSVPRIDITEFRPYVLGAPEFSQEAADYLVDSCRTWLRVRSLAGRWQVSSSGGVGQVQLPDGRVLRVAPRVPVRRIFEMWQIAFRCPPSWLPGSVDVETVSDLYDWIVHELAAGTKARIRRGISRSYVQVADRIPSLRGRLVVPELAGRPWDVSLPCIFHQFSADVPDNQILASALRAAARALPPGKTRDLAQSAYHELLQHGVSAWQVSPDECLSRRYHRLNREYEWLHWLSYFVLSSSGPDHGPGAAPLRSFLIDMPRLFERFVGEWLSRELHRRSDYVVRCAPRHSVGERNWFIPDVLLMDGTGRPCIVLDTKYKLEIRRDDVNQVIAYATKVGCQEAVLVYPSGAQGLKRWEVGPVRVRSLAFPLDIDLNDAGRQFLDEVLSK
jgi:5-methylcytosine-specific restriction enzyme subunit McrC